RRPAHGPRGHLEGSVPVFAVCGNGDSPRRWPPWPLGAAGAADELAAAVRAHVRELRGTTDAERALEAADRRLAVGGERGAAPLAAVAHLERHQDAPPASASARSTACSALAARSTPSISQPGSRITTGRPS